MRKHLNLHGVDVTTIKAICSRIETGAFVPTNTAPQILILEFFRNTYHVNTHTYQTRHIINIFLLNLLTTYRGWRHSRGLPVRGQRTWSNGWSSYRSNLLLRSFKLKVAKHLYGGNNSNDFMTAYLAEEVNNMWKLQWGAEWQDARKKRLAAQQNSKVLPKIDLTAAAKLHVVTDLAKNSTKAKQRKKGVFTIGFDPGFTKKLLPQIAIKNNICLSTRLIR